MCGPKHVGLRGGGVALDDPRPILEQVVHAEREGIGGPPGHEPAAGRRIVHVLDGRDVEPVRAGAADLGLPELPPVEHAESRVGLLPDDGVPDEDRHRREVRVAQPFRLRTGLEEIDRARVGRPIGRVDDLAEGDAAAGERREPQLGLGRGALEQDGRLPVRCVRPEQLGDRAVGPTVEGRPDDRRLLDAEARDERRDVRVAGMGVEQDRLVLVTGNQPELPGALAVARECRRMPRSRGRRRSSRWRDPGSGCATGSRVGSSALTRYRHRSGDAPRPASSAKPDEKRIDSPSLANSKIESVSSGSSRPTSISVERPGVAAGDGDPMSGGTVAVGVPTVTVVGDGVADVHAATPATPSATIVAGQRPPRITRRTAGCGRGSCRRCVASGPRSDRSSRPRPRTSPCSTSASSPSRRRDPASRRRRSNVPANSPEAGQLLRWKRPSFSCGSTGMASAIRAPLMLART